ncbi:hypothetical protein BJX65DRAFT_295578 [Aspergillus insuetus]
MDLGIAAKQADANASVEDVVALGAGQESVEAWRQRCRIQPNQQIRLVRLAYMRYLHPDLDKTTVATDFGMVVAHRTETEIWFRGYGTDAYVYYGREGPKAFLGGVYEVVSYQDLEKWLTDAPGKGHLVALTDPSGLPKIIYNYEIEKPCVRKSQQFNVGPAAVHKEANGQKKDVAVVPHIDRGEGLVDHHSFFINSDASTHAHHSSFEAHDFDTQKLGHQWLAGKGYTSVWGVVRHILGFKIFDYWWDTTGNTIEHYADGDLVNNKTPIGYGPAGDESLAVWGLRYQLGFCSD